jgi:hypothetical protein
MYLKLLARIVVKIPRFWAWIATDSRIGSKKILKRVQYKLQITKTAKGFSVLKN